MLIINPVIQIIEQNNYVVILKIKEELIKLSPIEYKIINFFSTNNNYKEVIENFKNVVKIEESQLEILLSKCKENNLLIKDSNIPDKTIKILGVEISFSFKKNNKIFELINIDLTTTLFDHFFSHKVTSKILTFAILLFTIFCVIAVLNSPLNFKENYFTTLYQVPFKFSSLIGFIYLSAFVSIVFHELGHYMFYKLVNGKTTIFGLGLMFYIFPVFYTKIYNSLIEKKKDRVLVNFGGLIFDALLVLFILFFTKYFHNQYPTLSFFAYTLLISIAIRSFFNSNIFLPGTDGYHILCDSINEKDLFKTSIIKFKLISKKIEPLTAKNSVYMVYLLFSLISIAISWGMFFVPIVMYFYYEI